LHGFADAEQTKFAVFNIVSKWNTDVETSVSLLVVKYRISVQFCGISIRKQHVMPYSAVV